MSDRPVSIINRVVPLETLQAHPENFRNHPDEQIQQLAKSYQRFGQFRSVVCQQLAPDQYLLVAGHGIVEAMRREGVKEVRVDVLPSSMNAEQIKGILVADNLLAQGAQDDEAALVALLEEQKHAGYDLASLGTDDEALRQMLESLGNDYLAQDGQSDKPDVQFKEFDESIEEGMDTELCQECGKVCLKMGKGKK